MRSSLLMLYTKTVKEGARKALHDFWFDIATTSRMMTPFKSTAWEAMFFGWENLDRSASFYAFDAFTKAFSRHTNLILWV